MLIGQFTQLHVLQCSNLRSDQYSLNHFEITPNIMQHLLVFDRDSTNIGDIANLKPGTESAAKTGQFTD